MNKAEVKLADKFFGLGVIMERLRAANIARNQFLVTPNGRDCGEHIAQLIEKDGDKPDGI